MKTLVALVAVLAVVFVAGAIAVPSWSITESVVSPATPEQIWAWYADTKDWPNWDHLVQRVDAHGPFAAGSTTTNTANGLTMTSRLEEVVPYLRYTEVMQMPLAKLIATHELHRVGNTTRLDHGLIVVGPGAWIYEFWQRAALARGMDAAMHRLAADARDGSPHTYIK